MVGQVGMALHNHLIARLQAFTDGHGVLVFVCFFYVRPLRFSFSITEDYILAVTIEHRVFW